MVVWGTCIVTGVVGPDWGGAHRVVARVAMVTGGCWWVCCYDNAVSMGSGVGLEVVELFNSSTHSVSGVLHSASGVLYSVTRQSTIKVPSIEAVKARRVESDT